MKSHLWIIATVLTLLVSAGFAEQVVVDLTPVADTDIREIAPTYAKSDRDVFLVKSFAGESAKIYIKYQLPGDIKELISAEFTIDRTFAGAYNYTYDIFGMLDSAPGNDWPELSPGEIPGLPYTSGLTWNNAPANDPCSMCCFDADATGALASFTVIGANNGGSAPDTYSASSQDLADFILTDTDGVITLLIGRQGTSSSFDLFATKEHATLNPPTLTLTYEPLQTVTVTLTPAADTDIRQAAPDYCKSNRDIWLAKNNTNDGIKTYIKFQLPDDVDTVLSAEFQTTRKIAGAWNFVYNIHGMNDNAVGNDWPEISPGNIPGLPYTSGLTWNNAPVNDANSTYGFTSDATGVLAAFTVIGSNNGGTPGDTYTASSPALADFLNTDTDSVVTLLIGRPGFSSSADQFYTKDQAVSEPPKLVITYVPTCGVRLLSDLNWDCATDIADFAYLAYDWLGTDPNLFMYTYSDIDRSDEIDAADLEKLAQGWLACSDAANPACDEFWKPELMAPAKWDAWRATWTDSFPVAAWAYFSRYDGTVAEYTTYADAGLTMVQAPLNQFNNAVAAGLRPLIGSWENLYLDKSKLDSYVNFPSPTSTLVTGYMLKDEPKPITLMEQISQATSYIYYYDQRDAIPIVNLLPNYGSWNTDHASYEDYVDAYMSTNGPAVLSYDHYPILADGSNRPHYYDNIEIIRDRAVAADIGFMGFALVNPHYSYRLPSESDLNWEVYSLLTYGAQGLFYYNYRIEPVGGFGEGLVTHADGTPTSTYPMAQAVNAEVHAMGPVLMSLQTVGVYHADVADPNNTLIDLYTNGDVAALSDFTGSGFIIGEFVNQDNLGDTDTYLMVCNKSHAASTDSATLAKNAMFTPNPSNLNVYLFNTATENWDLLIGGAPYTVNVGGGKAVLLRLSAD